MLNISAKTKKPSEKIIIKTKDFFGEKGLGLDLTEEAKDCLTFSGGGGYVTLTICPEEKENRVDIVTQEWEHQVKEFILKL